MSNHGNPSGKTAESAARSGVERKLVEVCCRNDVDIAIEFDISKPKTLFDLVGLEDELSAVFKRKVDLGIFSSLSPYIVDDVKREMRVIYEKR